MVYMKIFHNSTVGIIHISRIVNYVLAIIIAAYYTAGSLVSLLQCTPVHKAWHRDAPGTCIDNERFRLANAYINIITSVCLVAIPFPALLSVKRRNREIWQFMGLIALGCM